MKRILLDTNVVLDVLLEREPWSADAAALWKANDTRALRCHVTASSLTDVYYIARRIRGEARRGPAPALPWEHIYGVTTFELG